MWDHWKNRGSHHGQRQRKKTVALEVPKHVMWICVILIGLTVGMVNFTMVIIDGKVLRFKFSHIQDLLWEQGVVPAVCILVTISVACTFVASSLTVFLAPFCAGSGLPEIKGYLNGNPMPGLFVLQRMWIRIIGIVLVIAAGLPLGREGPMVCIGGSCGLLILTKIIKPYFVKWIRLAAEDELSIVMEEDHYNSIKRVGCTLGAAAGIAAAFNAPIGGCLYMFEETSGIINWSSFLTFGSLVCCGVAVLTNTFLISALGIDYREVYQLVLFSMPEHERIEREPWNWLDLIYISLIAITCGVISHLFSTGCLRIWKARQHKYNVVRSGKIFIWGIVGWRYFNRGLGRMVTRCNEFAKENFPSSSELKDRARPSDSMSFGSLFLDNCRKGDPSKKYDPSAQDKDDFRDDTNKSLENDRSNCRTNAGESRLSNCVNAGGSHLTEYTEASVANSIASVGTPLNEDEINRERVKVGDLIANEECKNDDIEIWHILSGTKILTAKCGKIAEVCLTTAFIACIMGLTPLAARDCVEVQELVQDHRRHWAPYLCNQDSHYEETLKETSKGSGGLITQDIDLTYTPRKLGALRNEEIGLRSERRELGTAHVGRELGTLHDGRELGIGAGTLVTHFNPIATMFLQGEEGAIKHLFARDYRFRSSSKGGRLRQLDRGTVSRSDAGRRRKLDTGWGDWFLELFSWSNDENEEPTSELHGDAHPYERFEPHQLGLPNEVVSLNGMKIDDLRVKAETGAPVSEPDSNINETEANATDAKQRPAFRGSSKTREPRKRSQPNMKRLFKRRLDTGWWDWSESFFSWSEDEKEHAKSQLHDAIQPEERFRLVGVNVNELSSDLAEKPANSLNATSERSAHAPRARGLYKYHGKRLESTGELQGETTGHTIDDAAQPTNETSRLGNHAFSYLELKWLFMSFCVYAPLAMLIPGLAMPFGMFIPNLFMGATLGRMGGEIARIVTAELFQRTRDNSSGLIQFRSAHPGFYAVCGAGAMLSGFTHMSIAIVALLVEATHDMDMVIPIVVAIGFSSLTNKLLSTDNFDEHLIKLKKVPILHTELSQESRSKPVSDVMERFVVGTPLLKTDSTKLSEIVKLLDMHPSLSHFVVASHSPAKHSLELVDDPIIRTARDDDERNTGSDEEQSPCLILGKDNLGSLYDRCNEDDLHNASTDDESKDEKRVPDMNKQKMTHMDKNARTPKDRVKENSQTSDGGSTMEPHSSVTISAAENPHCSPDLEKIAAEDENVVVEDVNEGEHRSVSVSPNPRQKDRASVDTSVNTIKDEAFTFNAIKGQTDEAFAKTGDGPSPDSRRNSPGSGTQLTSPCIFQQQNLSSPHYDREITFGSLDTNCNVDEVCRKSVHGPDKPCESCNKLGDLPQVAARGSNVSPPCGAKSNMKRSSATSGRGLGNGSGSYFDAGAGGNRASNVSYQEWRASMMQRSPANDSPVYDANVMNHGTVNGSSNHGTEHVVGLITRQRLEKLVDKMSTCRQSIYRPRVKRLSQADFGTKGEKDMVLEEEDDFLEIHQKQAETTQKQLTSSLASAISADCHDNRGSWSNNTTGDSQRCRAYSPNLFGAAFSLPRFGSVSKRKIHYLDYENGKETNPLFLYNTITKVDGTTPLYYNLGSSWPLPGEAFQAVDIPSPCMLNHDEITKSIRRLAYTSEDDMIPAFRKSGAADYSFGGIASRLFGIDKNRNRGEDNRNPDADNNRTGGGTGGNLKSSGTSSLGSRWIKSTSKGGLELHNVETGSTGSWRKSIDISSKIKYFENMNAGRQQYPPTMHPSGSGHKIYSSGSPNPTPSPNPSRKKSPNGSPNFGRASANTSSSSQQRTSQRTLGSTSQFGMDIPKVANEYTPETSNALPRTGGPDRPAAPDALRRNESIAKNSVANLFANNVCNRNVNVNANVSSSSSSYIGEARASGGGGGGSASSSSPRRSGKPAKIFGGKSNDKNDGLTSLSILPLGAPSRTNSNKLKDDTSASNRKDETPIEAFTRWIFRPKEKQEAELDRFDNTKDSTTKKAARDHTPARGVRQRERNERNYGKPQDPNNLPGTDIWKVFFKRSRSFPNSLRIPRRLALVAMRKDPELARQYQISNNMFQQGFSKKEPDVYPPSRRPSSAVPDPSVNVAVPEDSKTSSVATMTTPSKPSAIERSESSLIENPAIERSATGLTTSILEIDDTNAGRVSSVMGTIGQHSSEPLVEGLFTPEPKPNNAAPATLAAGGNNFADVVEGNTNGVGRGNGVAGTTQTIPSLRRMSSRDCEADPLVDADIPKPPDCGLVRSHSTAYEKHYLAEEHVDSVRRRPSLGTRDSSTTAPGSKNCESRDESNLSPFSKTGCRGGKHDGEGDIHVRTPERKKQSRRQRRGSRDAPPPSRSTGSNNCFPNSRQPNPTIMGIANAHATDVDAVDMARRKARAWESGMDDTSPASPAMILDIDDDDPCVSLWNLIDPAPYCVGPHFPIQRIYPLFISAHPVAAVVVCEQGKLCGVLTRRHLISLSSGR